MPNQTIGDFIVGDVHISDREVSVCVCVCENALRKATVIINKNS